MDIDKYLTDAEVYDLFIQNINDEAFYFDEEGFIEFLDALYNEGQITKEQYDNLSFDMIADIIENVADEV